MAESLTVSGTTKKEKYESLLPQIKALVEGEPDLIANISNMVAALKSGMDFFWVGVYFVKPSIAAAEKTELVLGPFQGPVACTRIALGKGVCGAAWQQKQTIIVEDVDLFPRHIACSSLSRSEMVLPAFDKSGNVLLVLDVDSEHLAAFDETDKFYLEQVMQLISDCAELNK